MLRTDVKQVFFDSRAVTSRLDAATRKTFSMIGAGIRRRAMKSLKYAKGRSSPGTPPNVHRSEGFRRKFGKSKTGRARPSSPLKELIQFAYDESRRSVVVGPLLFRASKLGGGVAPRVQEEGGTAPVLVDGKISRGVYPARPYMAPALGAEEPRAKQLLRDMMR
jgi:hypothetical protein